ncbi:autophagy protein 6 [Amniculicola lignicola CBS 123094]|uniref:Autophagy protein 6 n=1 Tax=Amniculicola lignicola CBS 123094 TaxID=1392246 RepID=A0A6A5WI84_9PLEO|nr:autophagy protein 6 [Amniculicola lignicola CBS 123094]
MSFVNIHMSESMLDPPSSPPSHRNPDLLTPVEEIGRAQKKEEPSRGGIMSEGMETTNRMFEILSARSDIDHPICIECTELLVDGLQKRLGTSTRERDAYVDYLRRANMDVPTSEEVKAAQAELTAAQKNEAMALSQLERLEAEKAELDAQLAALDAEARQLDQAEEDFWKGRNDFSTHMSSFQNERDALSARHAHDTQTLTQLQRRSVYNDTFNITHDNHFATINGLRLGRLPSPYVDWPEINAAWGQTCLLLATLAERLGYKFQGYELCPMGSTSTILKLEVKGGDSSSRNQSSSPSVTRQRLELYSSGEFPINFGFLHRKFDTAMIAFLECLRQLGEFVENMPGSGPAGGNPHVHGHAHSSTNTLANADRHSSPSPSLNSPRGIGVVGSMKMPYEIRKDKIHDQSIKLTLNKEELWTKACKYTLTCCKYLLAHANSVDAQRRAR